jgi:hypothetical protein
MLIRQQSGSVKTPQTRAELEAMVGRRDELKGQLRDAENRRLNLAAQLDATPTSARAPVQERLAAADARIAQLERQAALMDEAISSALANPKVTQGQGLLETPPAPPAVPAVPAPPGADVAPAPGEAWALIPGQAPGVPAYVQRPLIAFGIGAVLLAVLTGWIAYRMAVRRLKGAGAGPNSAHMSQLQQSVDAIALEVERISENQRYVTKIVNGLGAGGAEPIQSPAAEKAPSRGST